jgi:hypothetical protein
MPHVHKKCRVILYYLACFLYILQLDYYWEKVKLSRYRPGQALGVPEVEAPEFLENRHMKVVRLSALRTGHLYPQKGFLVLISVRD